MKNRSAPNHGFALVIALSLMAFILLLILSITTLVRVETESANIQLAQLEARMNAKLGAMIALGDLQRYTGPDQRVTGTGELIDTTADSKKHHTVVWDATEPTSADPISWLVSKSEQVVFNEAGASDTEWPILVSERTSDGNLLAEAVRAEPVPITGQNNENTGEYAWWVGDEGVKAKLTLVEDENLIAGDSTARLRTATRSGVEALDAIGTTYSYEDSPNFRSDLSKAINAEQLSSSVSNLKAHSHDLTTYSQSLLVDVQRGGLKEDLTYILNKGVNAGSIFQNIKDRDDEKYGSLVIPDAYNRITWEQLAAYHDLAKETGTSSISARAQTKESYGVFPILTMLSINFAVLLDSNYTNSTQTPADREYHLNHHLRPWFVLANPYNVTLEVEDYRIRLQSKYTRVEIETDDSILEPLYPRILLKDIFKHMVFTVPSVSLKPGEAKIFTLSYDNDSAYGYTFNSSNYTTDYDCQLQFGGNQILGANTEQEFLFEEGWDAGFSSIRLVPNGNPQTLNGTLLEDGTRVKPLNWKLSNGGGTWVRTTLPDDAQEKLVQTIGPAGFNQGPSTQHLGHWLINDLPQDVYSRSWHATKNIPINTDWKKNNNSPGASSFMLFLNGGISEPVANTYSTNNGGWLTDLNFRSPQQVKMKQTSLASANYRTHFITFGAQFSHTISDTNTLGSDPSSFPWGAGFAAFSKDPVDSPKTVLFDLPRNDAESGMSSIGKLQHFNAGGYADTPSDWQEDLTSDLLVNVETAYAPAYTVGNSYVTPFVPRDKFYQAVGTNSFLDLSYVINDILFDRYLFSSVPLSGNIESLTNTRLEPFEPLDGTSFQNVSTTKVAEDFYIDGGFNVNSTSVEAWHAFLSSFRGVAFGGLESADAYGVFPRSLYQIEEYVDGSTNDLGRFWTGWRHIQESALNDLASAIVEEVKLRGPFLSMADFVNRDLMNAGTNGYDTRSSGALQSALDRTQNFEYFTLKPSLALDEAKATGKNLFDYQETQNLGGGKIIDADGSLLAPAATTAGVPGWALQGDLLQSLAPAMSVRSDTFLVRSYGSASNAFDSQDTTESYCELVVQRIPEYVDSAQDRPSVVTDDLQSATNQLMGRRYKIISQRYLTAAEL
jgi:hypothetical protein